MSLTHYLDRAIDVPWIGLLMLTMIGALPTLGLYAGLWLVARARAARSRPTRCPPDLDNSGGDRGE